MGVRLLTCAAVCCCSFSESDNDFLETCRASRLLQDLEDDDELPEPDDDDDENEDDNDDDDEFDDVMVCCNDVLSRKGE